jgi:membrane associated rhomboid family serine protease
MIFENSPAALIIFVLTIGVSLLALYRRPELFDKLMMHPYRIVHNKQWYRMISVGFIHADVPHLMFNMLSFYFFAFRLEYFTGTLQFIIIYFVSMVLSGISTVIKYKDNEEYVSVGASGAVAGVLFSYILFDPGARIGILFFPIGIPSPIFALLYLLYCWYAAKKAHDMINHWAHFWGSLAGLVLTEILYPGIIKNFFLQLF